MPSVSEFTEGMEKKEGFVTFYYSADKDKTYLAVSELNTPFLFQSSLPQGVGSNDIGLDRGQLGQTRLVKFERYGNKILLKQLNTQYRASSTNLAEQTSIDEAFADSVIAGFIVSAESDGVVLVDYTPFLLSDIHGIARRLSGRKEGNYKVDASRSGVFLPRSKAFPDNTELEAIVTYAGNPTGKYLAQVTPDANSVSVHLHHSLVRLPDDNFEKRPFHPFSGLNHLSFQDYSVPISDSMRTSITRRHRLHKKDPSAPISDPVEPIVYYLDPGIPEPIMSALKDGASWWDQAFTAIGYRNGFQVKVLPEGADPMDVRYNIIQWVHRATRGWSYGMSVVDPRTGEIIKGQVTLGSLRVRQDYLIALGLTSPFDGKDEDITPQKEMALARIRQLSAHEVGHTLGIAHNFAPSEYGRESVMDYPHPKITLKDGVISLEGAYGEGLGAWDKHVIAYGYQDFVSPEAEKAGLADIIASARNAGLRYKSDADVRSARHGSSDGHLWDNGEDPVAEFDHLTAVREVALNNLGINTIQTGDSLSSIEEPLVPIFLLHRFQLDVLAKQVGGIEYEYEQKGSYEKPRGQGPVSAKNQVAAIERMIKATTASYLTIPEKVIQLIPPKIFGDRHSREDFSGRMGRVFDPISAAEAAAGYSVGLLLQGERLNRLAWQHALDGDNPGVAAVIKKLLSVHFYRLKGELTPLKQRLQNVIVNSIMHSLADETLAPEVRLAIEGELMTFTEWLDDEDDVSAYKVLNHYFEHYWDTGTWALSFDVKPLPPGSPI
jgi:hypothetical protein